MSNPTPQSQVEPTVILTGTEMYGSSEILGVCIDVEDAMCRAQKHRDERSSLDMCYGIETWVGAKQTAHQFTVSEAPNQHLEWQKRR